MSGAAAVPDPIVPESPSDAVSSLHFAPAAAGGGGAAADYLCASSWDSTVSMWEVGATGECVPRAKTQQSLPVFTTSWNPDRAHVAIGGAEGVVKVWDLHSNQTVQIGQHAAPVKQVIDISSAAAAGMPVPSLVSGGWDAKIKYWDPRAPSASGAAAIDVDVPDKVYAMDHRGLVLVAATAERNVVVYDLRNPRSAYQTIASPLKFQSRSIALMPTGEGFALGSIEGRVAVHYITEPPPAGRAPFAFKCHRVGDQTYAVNQIVFHPVQGTFITAGGDGTFSFWDPVARLRLKNGATHGNSILCGSLNPTSTIFAYAVGYNWSRGADDTKKVPNHIALHRVAEADINRRVQQPQ